MANVFQDLDEFFDDSLTLTIGGKKYVIPSPEFEVGAKMKRQFELGIKILSGEEPPESGDLDDDEERDLYEQTLGPAYAQMHADGVNWQKRKRAGQTAFYWIVGEVDMALRFWKTGDPMDPELVARMENRAERRKATRGSGSPKKNGSGAASKQPAATTSGTRTRPRKG